MAIDGNGQVGHLVQIIGPVVDVEFSNDYLPPIYQSLRVTSEGFDVETKVDTVVEVQQHLGEGRGLCRPDGPAEGSARPCRSYQCRSRA